jgi:hypothetical protein
VTKGVVMRHWTDEERALLRRLHQSGTVSQSQMGARLGRSKNSVHRQLALLGLVYNERKPAVIQHTAAKATAARHAPRTTLPPLLSLMDD